MTRKLTEKTLPALWKKIFSKSFIEKVDPDTYIEYLAKIRKVLKAKKTHIITFEKIYVAKEWLDEDYAELPPDQMEDKFYVIFSDVVVSTPKHRSQFAYHGIGAGRYYNSWQILSIEDMQEIRKEADE